LDEAFMNEMASRPKTIQPYVMETSEEKKMKKWKKIIYLPGKYLRISVTPLHKSLFHVFTALF